jgi:TetR/AcrR family transcriptional regulator
MSKESWQRARSYEQVQERIDTILEAAGRVFQNQPYENVTMQMIAKEARFTRSNLYRYFNTREEIFLTLFMADTGTWIKQVKSALQPEMDLERFAKIWTEILCQQTRMLELAPLLSVSLERNTSEEIYRQAKLTLFERMSEAIPVLQRVFPFISVAQGFEFLLFHQALLAGAWPMAQYNDMQHRVLVENELDLLEINFAQFYEKSILMVLRGMIR